MAGAAVLAAALVWSGASSEVPWLFLLAAWVIGLVAAGGVYALWNRAGLSLSLEVLDELPAGGTFTAELPERVLRSAPTTRPLFEGDAMEIEVGLDTSGGERGPAWLSGLLGTEGIDVATGRVPRRGWRVRRVVGPLRRGPVDAAAWVIGSSDPFGLFQSRRGCSDVEVALVLPRFASLKRRRQVLELEASLPAARAGTGTDLFGVREYMPGDSLRRIHWRSSARQGRLVVREFEPPGTQSLGIFCDPAPATRAIADQIARLAASEAWDCIEDGGRVVLWAPGLEPTTPAEGRSLWRLLEWLARYPEVAGDWMSEPGPVGQVVWVTAGRNDALRDAVDAARRRGAGARGWVVQEDVAQGSDGAGDDPDFDGPHQRVGTSWPL